VGITYLSYIKKIIKSTAFIKKQAGYFNLAKNKLAKIDKNIK
jgi:hypothetical protein